MPDAESVAANSTIAAVTFWPRPKTCVKAVTPRIESVANTLLLTAGSPVLAGACAITAEQKRKAKERKDRKMQRCLRAGGPYGVSVCSSHGKEGGCPVRTGYHAYGEPEEGLGPFPF